MGEVQVNYDSPWKEALEQYFEAFVASLFKEAYIQINWSQGYEFLDQELQQVAREVSIGKFIKYSQDF